MKTFILILAAISSVVSFADNTETLTVDQAIDQISHLTTDGRHSGSQCVVEIVKNQYGEKGIYVKVAKLRADGTEDFFETRDFVINKIRLDILKITKDTKKDEFVFTVYSQGQMDPNGPGPTWVMKNSLTLQSGKIQVAAGVKQMNSVECSF